MPGCCFSPGHGGAKPTGTNDVPPWMEESAGRPVADGRRNAAPARELAAVAGPAGVAHPACAEPWGRHHVDHADFCCSYNTGRRSAGSGAAGPQPAPPGPQVRRGGPWPPDRPLRRPLAGRRIRAQGPLRAHFLLPGPSPGGLLLPDLALAADPRENTRVASKLSNDDIQALAVAARAGDRAAFDTLYHHFHLTIWRLCCSDLNWNSTDADDVAQNTFMNAFLKIESYRGETGAEFMGWLYTIARNSCIDWIRGHQRWVEKVRLAMSLAGSPFEWSQNLMRQDRPWRCIWREMARFEPKKRQVFILRSSGIKVDDIARMMKRRPGTIKTWLHDKKTGLLPVLAERCAGKGR